METPPDPSASFEHAWSRFHNLDALRLVEDTLESQWVRGRTDYLALLVQVQDAAVRRHIARFVSTITPVRGVEPYPEPYWHITIKGIGFLVRDTPGPDEVSERELSQIREAAAAVLHQQPAFHARIGPISAFPEVVFLEIWDEGRVRDLNALLLESVPLIPRYPVDGAVFLPHISIARFTSNEALVPLKQAVLRLREQGPGPALTVDRIDLISDRLSAGAPAFETIESYSLRR